MKNRLFLLFLLSLLSLCLVLPAAAVERTVTVRIEGAEDTLYYDTVSIPVAGVSVLDVLLLVDEADNGIDLVGIENGYISAVNNEAAGRTAKGWDGFGVRMDGALISYDRLATAHVNTGAEIVVYYADEFESGFLIPIMDDDDLLSGVLRFFAEVPQENGSYTVEAIEGATVRWYCGDAFATYVTDENGKIRIEKALLLSGDHRVWIDLRNEEGCPLLLRFAPDFTVNIPTAVGDSPAVYILSAGIVASVAAIAALLTSLLKKRSKK